MVWTVMGLTHVKVKIANPARPRRTAQLTCPVDSGAIYSVVPAKILGRLGIKPHSSRTLILADGTTIKRRLGDAIFRVNGERGASPVIFGDEGDGTLLGSVSLESIGLMLDPIKRVLKPLPMVIG